MRRVFLLSLSTMILRMGQLSAATWYVNDSASFPGDGTSWMNAFKTIQEGIDASFDGDTVIVAEATYYENIEFKGRNIILRSTDPTDPAVVANTIIDGRGAGSVVTLSGTETEACVLSGFTIRNGNSERGGGIYGGLPPDFNDNSDATIQNNTITGNKATNDSFFSSGGGLAFCDGMIQNNTITGNYAPVGGGLAACDGTIQNNVISGNSANAAGGLGEAYGTIQNNTITDNEATSRGGGLILCSGSIHNCIIWGNTAPTDPQLYNSSTPMYSCIQGWTEGGTGNITEDPRFVDPGNGDYRLSAGSPCADAGMNEGWMSSATDLDGNPRILYGGLSLTVDMGAHEFVWTWYVDDSVTSSGDGTSWATAIKTIQEGIDASFDGDTVMVAKGTYEENIRIGGKNIILRSTDPTDPAVVANTVIDGNQAGSVVTFSGTETEACVLSGFTIRNGDADMGGGIFGNGTYATIRNNTITGNSAADRGGGLFQCHGTIRDNTITGNIAFLGGGLRGCAGMIEKNTITGNTAADRGGGLSSCGATIQNNVISGNVATDNGGGLAGCAGTLESNTITNNSAITEGGGLWWCTGTIRNCIVWGNTAPTGPQLQSSGDPTYCCIQSWTGGGEGNITEDPQFVDPGHGDYHLSPGSPCIDVGMNEEWMGSATDLDGNPRIINGTVDMGAYEFVRGPDIETGLVGHWKLDETSGDVAYDSSGNGNHGTVYGDLQWVEGKIGGGLQFDGVDDYVETYYTTDLVNWTASVWVRSPAAPSGSRDTGPVHREANFQINWDHVYPDYRGAAALKVGDTWYPASFGTLQADTWYHLVATYDGGSLKTYTNGVLITENTDPSGNPTSEPNSLKFGRHAAFADYFGGTIDDVRVYNRPLSAGDVQELFKTRPPDIETGLVGHWKLDETSGNVAYDSSGNDNDGSLIGSPQWVEGKIGGGLHVDGVDDYVETYYTTDLATWTVSVWVTSPGAPDGDAPSGPVHREQNFQINWDHGDLNYRGAAALSVGGSWYPASFGTLQADTWYHLVATYDGESLKAYTDGVLIAENTAPSGTPTSEPNSLKFGRHAAAAQFFGGTIDDVRVYDRALSARDVQELFKTRPPDIETGLVGHWKLNETSGATAYDSSGNANDGTLIGDPHWVQGKLQGALQFDGIDDYVDCGNDSSLGITAEITLGVWVKTNDAANGQHNPYVTKGDHSYGIKHHTSNNIEYFIYDGGWQVARYPVDSTFNGVWHHLAGTYDGSELRLYIDGTLVTTVAHSGTIASSPFNVNIGRNTEASTRFYEGALDDVRIYNRALSAGDVQELFRWGKSFRITRVLMETTGGFNLTWASRPGGQYVIWSCTDLISGDWTDEEGVLSGGDSTSWTDPNPGGSRKFYRVEQY